MSLRRHRTLGFLFQQHRPFSLSGSSTTKNRFSVPAKERHLVGVIFVSHGRYVTFQMAEVAVSRQMFQEILSLIARLRAPPAPA